MRWLLSASDKARGVKGSSRITEKQRPSDGLSPAKNGQLSYSHLAVTIGTLLTEGASVQYGFHFDALRCTGCEDCVEACCAQHGIPRSLSFRSVESYEGGTWEESEDGATTTMLFTYFLSLSCNECSAPLCVAVCPTGALRKDARTGLVSLDESVCSGCGNCVEECPYGAPKINPDDGRAMKCDACNGSMSSAVSGVGPLVVPSCVEACSEHALEFGDIVRLRALYGSVASVPPLPPVEVAHPNLVLTMAPAMLDSLRWEGGREGLLERRL